LLGSFAVAGLVFFGDYFLSIVLAILGFLFVGAAYLL